MVREYDIRGMAEKVDLLRKNVEDLRQMSGGFPTIEKNTERILANVRMLEININDVAEVLGK